MKGRNIFTKNEIIELEKLIISRNKTVSTEQKAIRAKMRKIGFYGKDDWGIIDLHLHDFHLLIKSGRIKVSDGVHLTDLNSETAVLNKITKEKNKISNSDKDEHYVLNICDKILGLSSSRQHKFDFLIGDKNDKGNTSKLPVDSFYSELKLVIEYCERQHTESINFFDKPNRMTISGVHRGEQRKIYDERRRQILPKHQIKLIEISYSDFNYDRQKRIIRNLKDDEKIIREKLNEFVRKI